MGATPCKHSPHFVFPPSEVNWLWVLRDWSLILKTHSTTWWVALGFHCNSTSWIYLWYIQPYHNSKNRRESQFCILFVLLQWRRNPRWPPKFQQTNNASHSSHLVTVSNVQHNYIPMGHSHLPTIVGLNARNLFYSAIYQLQVHARGTFVVQKFKQVLGHALETSHMVGSHVAHGPMRTTFTAILAPRTNVDGLKMADMSFCGSLAWSVVFDLRNWNAFILLVKVWSVWLILATGKEGVKFLLMCYVSKRFVQRELLPWSNPANQLQSTSKKTTCPHFVQEQNFKEME